MINTFRIGDRVSFNGFAGTVVSNIVQVEPRVLRELGTCTVQPEPIVTFCYLVEFDKEDDLELLFECKKIDYSSSVGTVNEKFLTKVL
jgi:hypothetical protein